MSATCEFDCPVIPAAEPLFSRLPHDRTRPPGRVYQRDDVGPLITSQAFDWPGVLLEAGRNDVARVEELTLAHHYICLNTDPRPFTMHIREGSGTTPVTLAPGSVWLLPAGESATFDFDALFTYVRLTIDPRHLRGPRTQISDDEKPLELRRVYGISSPQLRHVVRALLYEADLGNPGGLAFVEALTAAVGYQLAQLAGVERPRSAPSRGGLGSVARRRALEMIDAKIGGHLSITTLASEVGLSTAHFSRAFKETVGRAPHQYLLLLRLQRARRMLEAPDASLSDVAFSCGFSDQAHFTRMFKREFGLTPGAVLRARRR